MREFSAGVFEEEFAVQSEGEREDVDKENRTVDQDWRAIEPEQDALIGNEVGQRLHTPEAKSQDDGDGQHECVRNHRCSLEGLVLAEIRDRKAQRIDRNKFVRNIALKNKHEIGGIQVTLDLAVIRGRVIDHVKVHTSLVGWGLHVFESDFLHINVDFGDGGVRDELLNDIVLAVGVDDAVRKLAVQEIEGLRKVILNRVAIAAVIERAELRQKILGLSILWLVLEVVIIDGFSPAQVVDSNDERTDVLKRANRSQVHKGESDGYKRDEDERDFQIGVGHHRIAILFEIESFRILKGRVVVHPKTLSRIPAVDPPAVPLKMWLVSAGIFRSV